jgi:predicted nucleic acid-binding protein
MALVVDASVAIKWFVEETGADRARDLWAQHDELVAPDLLVPEVCSAIWRKARLGQIVADQALEAVGRLKTAVTHLRPTAPLATRAMRLATELDHPVYDCFYLALAEFEGSPVVTADDRLLRRLSGSSFEALARAL